MTARILQFPVMDKSEPDRKFPNRLRELRKAQGWTLKQLGEKTGIIYTQLQKLETGEQPLRDHYMERIAPVLGVKPADLLNFDDGGLSPEERALIDTYREIPRALRRSFDSLRESHQPFRGAGEIVPLDREEDTRRKA